MKNRLQFLKQKQLEVIMIKELRVIQITHLIWMIENKLQTTIPTGL